MADLTAPEFVHVDPVAIEADLVARFEAKTEKTLHPAQIERLYINQIAYAHALALTRIQATGEQMLVRFSTGPILDYLGELVGTPRLLAQPARCLVEVANPDNKIGAVAAGARLASSDGSVVFEIDRDVDLAMAPVTVTATCVVAGTAGNGWKPGALSSVSDDVAAANVTTSADGRDDEADDRYRERIISAPESYTDAGSYGAYRFHAMAAHPSIVDAKPHGPAEGEPPGVVAVYVLADSGVPSATLLATVSAKLSADTVRPLCDTVQVRAPQVVDFKVRAALTFYDDVDRTTVMARAQVALADYLAGRQAKLGADIVPSQISAVLHVAGVYHVELVQPQAQVLTTAQWARCTSVDLTDAGVAHG